MELAVIGRVLGRDRRTYCRLPMDCYAKEALRLLDNEHEEAARCHNLNGDLHAGDLTVFWIAVDFEFTPIPPIVYGLSVYLQDHR